MKEWVEDNYYKRQDKALSLPEGFKDEIERVHVNDITVEEFVEKFERPSRPVIIQGIADTWPAFKKWTFRKLLKKYADSKFKIGESDSGKKLKVTLKEYLEYTMYNRDDSPLYLFESSLEEHPEAKKMMNDYKPGKFFDDLFVELLGEKKAPPHRWFLIGP
jgi:histone arginine demethylase JMJD6